MSEAGRGDGYSRITSGVHVSPPRFLCRGGCGRWIQPGVLREAIFHAASMTMWTRTPPPVNPRQHCDACYFLEIEWERVRMIVHDGRL